MEIKAKINKWDLSRLKTSYKDFKLAKLLALPKVNCRSLYKERSNLQRESFKVLWRVEVICKDRIIVLIGFLKLWFWIGEKAAQHGYQVLVAQSCLTLCNPMGCSPPAPLWDFPGKKTEVGCNFLLQRIVPDPGIEPRFPALQENSLLSDTGGKYRSSWHSFLCFLHHCFG